MSEYVLRTRDISKKYGDAYAIKNVSVAIKRGQIYGLIGLNGAGKTTFMRAVVGLISLTGCEVELFGQTGEQALQRGRRRIGQIIETPAVYPNMTAEQNLTIQCILAGVPDQGVIKPTLDLVGLADTGKKKAKNFSLGMKQRLALAIALITKSWTMWQNSAHNLPLWEKVRSLLRESRQRWCIRSRGMYGRSSPIRSVSRC